VHDRWAQLSKSDLASATGRSETAVGQAARALQGAWIERVQPGNGPYQYRFLPEQVGDRPEEKPPVSPGTANDPAPDRQKSDPPSSYEESSFRDKHSCQEEKRARPPEERPSPGETDAVPANNSSENPSGPEETHQRSTSTQRSNSGKAPPPDFTGLPPEKQDLAEKLSNVGVWASRIAEVLSRFSTQRIRANFQLYRRRAAQQVIRKPGAWLYAAITNGYVLPNASPNQPESDASPSPGALPPLQHKETVSEAKKDAYVAQGRPGHQREAISPVPLGAEWAE